MGAIQDRTREHLGTTDKVIMANRRMLLKAIETVQAGGTPPGVADPDNRRAPHGPRHGGRHRARRRLAEAWWRDAGAGQARQRALGCGAEAGGRAAGSRVSPHEEAS